MSGQQVVGKIGGKLNVESLQDLDHYDSKEQGAGFGVSICVPPICGGNSSVTASLEQMKMRSHYAAVGEQSGSNVTFNAAQDIYNEHLSQRTKRSGLTFGNRSRKFD